MSGATAVRRAIAAVALVLCVRLFAGASPATVPISQIREAPVHPSLASAEVRAVEVTTTGDVWVAVRDRGLARIRGDDVRWVTMDDGLMSTGVADLHEDRRGRLWAVGLGGYSVLEGGRWVARDRFGSLEPRVVFSVHEEPAGRALWLAASGGAGRLENGEWSVIRESDGLPHEVVHAVVVDGRGSAWLACRTGLARVDEDGIEVLFTGVNFRSALTGPGDALWFGTSDGIYEWDGDSWRRHLEGITVYTRLVASDGSIWAGSASEGVFRYADGAWRAIELPARLQGAEVFDLAEGPDGSIWLATSGGLSRLLRLGP